MRSDMFGLGSATSRDATEPSFEAIYRAVLEVVAAQPKTAPKPIGKVSISSPDVNTTEK